MAGVMAGAHSTAVLGAGSWGTALALVLARNGHQVRLWGRDSDQLDRMAAQRCNERYLPGYEFPDCLHPCIDMAQAVNGASLVLLAVPSHGFAACLQQLAQVLPVIPDLLWATKGFEPDSARLLDDLVVSTFGPGIRRAVLSGPSFAREVAAGLPTAVTLAASHPDYGRDLAETFHDRAFRIYTSDDLVGVQVGGAVKNVLAIAAGIADGLAFGANTRAALITRGLAELSRLGAALGGRQSTFMGLAGLGDLLLTCTDDQSRNRRFGLALANNETPTAAMARLGQAVEGYRNTREVMMLATRHRLEMPICGQVEQVLYHQLDPREAVQSLLARALTREDG